MYSDVFLSPVCIMWIMMCGIELSPVFAVCSTFMKIAAAFMEISAELSVESLCEA